MKIFNSLQRTGLLLVMVVALFAACNKLDLDAVPNPPAEQGTTPTLADLINGSDYTLLKAAVEKAGLLPTLQQAGSRYTLFAPDDAAVTASLTPILPPGVTPAMYIGSLDAATAYGLVAYHIMPQEVDASSIATTFPNFEYPSILNPAPTVSTLLRLSTFPSKRAGAGAWVNNIPVTGTDIKAVNGVMHKVARIIMPPSVDLWAGIQNDASLTFFKAAIARADSGVAAGSRLQDAMNTGVNPSALGANLTVFAPTDAAMKTFLTGAITQALVGQGLDPLTAQGQATFLVTTYGTLILTNPYALSPVLGAAISPTLAKGIVAYHIVASQSGSFAPPGIRVFSVNMPATATGVKTLLNSAGGAYAAHPGISIQANFAPGLPVVASATVKGVGNATASNIIIGPTSSDLHFVNGVLHKIDQALLPQ